MNEKIKAENEERLPGGDIKAAVNTSSSESPSDILPGQSKWLYLDDYRIPSHERFHLVSNYEQFVEYIESHGVPDLISFDHDLHEEHINHYHVHGGAVGDEDYEKFEFKTGYDCAKYLVDYCMRTGAIIKKVFIHSHNPVGAKNIMSYLTNYKKSLGLEPHEWEVWYYEPTYTIPKGEITW